MLPLLLALLSLAADPAPAPEPPKAESLSVEEATVRCESGESEVCSQVGGWLVDHNQPGRGARLLQLGCDQGHALACRNLAATLFVDTQEGGPDNVRAVALHEKACGLGEEHGCADAGWALMFGRGGVEPDPEKGRMYLDKACSLGLIQSCVELGGALATGMAGTPGAASPTGLSCAGSRCDAFSRAPISARIARGSSSANEPNGRLSKRNASPATYLRNRNRNRNHQ